MGTPRGEPARRADGVLVAINGSPADGPVLTWAAEEADRTGRPLVISYAAGHLPRELTYAERAAAREQRLDEGRRVTEHAADWVRSQSPTLRIETVVRLLQPWMLLPAVAEGARTVTQSAASWSNRIRLEARGGPVLAGLATAADAHVLRAATDQARRRGLELIVLDDEGPELARAVVERSNGASMVFLSRPPRDAHAKAVSWSIALDTFARSLSPVVLVAGDAAPRPSRRTLG